MPNKAEDKRSVAEIRAENRLLRKVQNSQALASVLALVVKWGSLVLIARYAAMSVSTLAGQATAADIGIRFLADVRVSEALAWVLGFGGTLYGIAERRLRRKAIMNISCRAAAAEARLDPGRSSSMLEPNGETRKEDR